MTSENSCSSSKLPSEMTYKRERQVFIIL